MGSTQSNEEFILSLPDMAHEKQLHESEKAINAIMKNWRKKLLSTVERGNKTLYLFKTQDDTLIIDRKRIKVDTLDMDYVVQKIRSMINPAVLTSHNSYIRPFGTAFPSIATVEYIIDITNVKRGDPPPTYVE